MEDDTVAKTGTIAILGAGSWGATLAWLLASNKRHVNLWSHDAGKVARLTANRQIEKPLSIQLPVSVNLYDDLGACVVDASIILFCCNAQSVRSVASQMQETLIKGRALRPESATVTTAVTNSSAASPAILGVVSNARLETARVGGAPALSGCLATKKILVTAAKGIELHTFDRMSSVLQQTLPGFPVCALSGPNLAAEVLRGLPTASVVACSDFDSARLVQEALSVRSFRVYTNEDTAGVELGGALKNIIAIAAGVVDGLALGTNAKAALMTRGLAEMTRLAVALGAKATTLSGLAGVGDLVATCYSSLSRNYSLGYNLAKGETLSNAVRELGAVAEGVTTTRAVCELSQKLGIELPIAEQVDRTLRGVSSPEKAIMTLMARPLASE